MFTLFHPKPLLSYRSPQQLTHLCLLVLFVPPSLARSQRVEHSDFVYLDADVIDAMVTDKLTHVDVTDVMHLQQCTDGGGGGGGGLRFIHRSRMVLGADEYLRRRFYRDNGASTARVASQPSGGNGGEGVLCSYMYVIG